MVVKLSTTRVITRMVMEVVILILGATLCGDGKIAVRLGRMLVTRGVTCVTSHCVTRTNAKNGRTIEYVL